MPRLEYVHINHFKITVKFTCQIRHKADTSFNACILKTDVFRQTSSFPKATCRK